MPKSRSVRHAHAFVVSLFMVLAGFQTASTRTVDTLKVAERSVSEREDDSNPADARALKSVTTLTDAQAPVWANHLVIPSHQLQLSFRESGNSFLTLFGTGTLPPTSPVSATSANAGSIAGVPCSAQGCLPNSSNENEDCNYAMPDTVNGGCVNGVSRATPLAPFQIICGQTWAVDDGNGPTTDVDWYLTPQAHGDSLTWSITSEFEFEFDIWIVYSCFGQLHLMSGSGPACDTTRVSISANTDQYAIAIRPATSAFVAMECNLGPWNYHIGVVNHCGIPCPMGSIAEGEGCSVDPSVDNFNGGCLSFPNVYSTITPEQSICGEVSGSGFSRDTDWYRTAVPLAAGDAVSWIVSANFPHAIYVIDQRRGCVTREVGADLSDACETSVVEWVVDSSGVYSFVVGTLQSDHGYLCNDGPWAYTATLYLCAFGAARDCTAEGETCVDISDDFYNGGCNSPTYALQPIGLGERICGQAWRQIFVGTSETHVYRDTDWYVYEATAGEILTWTVQAEYGVDIGLFHPSPGFPCSIVSFAPYTWTTTNCYPISLTYQVPEAGPIIFYVAPGVPPVLPGPQLVCADGPWDYEAIIESAPCACQCAGDPECDGVVNVFDVTHAINVAFRGAASLPDPYVQCPWEMTDVDCSGTTNIFDVTRLINVAFRGGDQTVEFCDPCLANELY